MSNIFVVDDSISVRKALELALSREGLNVRTAASAEAALEQLGHEPTDLVIADVIMPGQSGFELCELIKADDRYRHVPVLIISGNVDADTRQRAQAVGAVGVLKKPFRQEELLPAVQRALASVSQAQPVGVQAPAPSTAASGPTDSSRPSASAALQALQTPGTLSAALIGQDGQMLEHQGEPLPENIGLFARFYLGTADFLAGQLGERSAQQLDLDLGGKRLTIRPLEGQLLLTVHRD